MKKTEVTPENFDPNNMDHVMTVLKECVTHYKDVINKYKDDFKEEKDKSRKEKIEEYKIRKLKATTNKTKYIIEFTLTKKNGTWMLDKVSNETLMKIHGLSE